MQLSQEAHYLLLVIGLFIVPRLLQRFRLPTAITALALGAGLGMGLGLFQGDASLKLLATFGIVALFLFAGLEVDLSELRRGLKVTAGHIAVQLGLLFGGVLLFGTLFELSWRAATLFSLSLLTPSTGFILDSLPAFGLSEQARYWVKTKAIATELVALGALFVVVQSGSALTLGISSLALVALIGVLPYVFRFFARFVLPHAPKSEFAFLLILALLCAYLTRHLGVYYLVGAFVVGVTAVRMRKRLPALASDRLLIGIELFASFFIPFYFFRAGLGLTARFFTPESVGLGLLFVLLGVPLRVGSVALHRHFALGEGWRCGAKVGLSLVPTLVFTLVLAEILRTRYGLPDHLYGSLLVFTLVNTTLPGFFLRTPPDFDAPEAPRFSETGGL